MIVERQFVQPTPTAEHRDGMYWWYSPTAYIVKWSIVSAIFVGFFLWITIGYYHARQRLKKGLKPLAYHRWLVPRSQQNPEPQNSYAYYDPQPAAFPMQGYQEPPPMYTRADMPPSYQPPPGGSKVAPQQPQFDARPPQGPQGPQQTGVV